MQQFPQQFTQRVNEWQERLLQLDRRNRLLYLNPGRNYPILLEDETANHIVDLLERKGSEGASFAYVEELRATDEEEAGTVFDRVTRGDLRSDCPVPELQRRLGYLRSRQREWEEEQGLPVLYLALGLLHWVDDRDNDAIAPLLLLSCSLTRAGLRSPFRLALNDDDLALNETLRFKLNKDLGISLPEIEADMKPSEYFDSVKQSIAGTVDWKIEDSVYLGIFSYSKLAMWRDLETLKSNGTDNEIVKVMSRLSDSPGSIPTSSAIPVGYEALAGGGLDDLLHLKDQSTILPADYSQLIAIADARDGLNLVVHGPPGTGKSQTIANIIATCMAEGKSVLFVSEKTAALDVVKRRLDEAGLGLFCLDLHSERGRKANVYAQLQDSVQYSRTVRNTPLKPSELNSKRSNLNAVVRALHEVRQPIGISIYQAQGHYASLEGVPRLRLNLPTATGGINQAWLREMREALAPIAARGEEYLQHETSIWRALKTTIPGMNVSDEVRDDMSTIQQGYADAAQNLALIAKEIGWDAPTTLESTAILEEIFRHFTTAPGVVAEWIKISQDRVKELLVTASEEKQDQRIARLIESIAPAPSSWASQDGVDKAKVAVTGARAAAYNLKSAEESLLASCSLDITTVVDSSMFERYSVGYQSWIQRIFSRDFRVDQRSLRQFMHDPRKITLSEGYALVMQAMRVIQQREEWDNRSAQWQSLVGERFNGRDSDWSTIEQDLDTASELVNSLNSIQKDMQNLQKTKQGKERRAWAEIHQELQASLSSHDPLANWHAIKPWSREQPDSLQQAFMHLYNGLDTDWQDIIQRLEWVKGLLGVIGQHEISQDTVMHAVGPIEPEQYERLAAQAHSVRARLEEIWGGLKHEYEVPVHKPSEAATFAEIQGWARQLHDDAGNADGWVRYRNAVKRVETIVGTGAISECRKLTDNAALVPQIVERAVFQKIVEYYGQDNLISNFASVDQEHLRKEFRRLDEGFPAAVQSDIRERMFRHYDQITDSWGMGRLNRELAKKRRQKSVRALMRDIPECIKDLKPCFLMSPLAVSQYLSHTGAPVSKQDGQGTETDQNELLFPLSATFDVVVFDEASQVFPEDAVPALLHGKQVIIAGDQQQLPPSNFWNRSRDTDDDYDDDADDETDDEGSYVGIDSILDAAVGPSRSLFHQRNLKTHYRSRHEDLIRFSNHHFYKDRGGLLTFPSPGAHSEWQGVHRHFMPDALYEGSGSRTNPEEAQRVADLVMEHARAHPDKSLGVAALSRNQADRIQRLVNARRLTEGELESFFTESGPEPFFVKNLENVQGDERDRMIISIGYGPTTKGGPTPNRFGPMNAEGGKRRLNVLVTRARERMDVVHSLDPAHVTSDREGARLLRRFLEYAANPKADLSAGPSTSLAQPTGDELNDFEKAVKDALEKRGHRVVGQVGSSGYVIDLGILSEDGARYDLGVECDGATYHSAPAARDRDWLRQSVLEGLGWAIHRVWSTSWARNPDAEIARIEEALKLARARTTPVSGKPEPAGAANSEAVTATPETMADTPVESISARSPVQLAPYTTANLASFRPVGELRFASFRHLAEMAAAIAEVEGPVHPDVVIERIRDRYGIGRVRGSTRDHVKHAIGQAVMEGKLLRTEDFLHTKPSQLNREPRVLVDENIEHAPPSELRTLITQVANRYRSPQEELAKEVTMMLGFARKGRRIAETVSGLISELVEEGRLEAVNGIIRPARA